MMGGSRSQGGSVTGRVHADWEPQEPGAREDQEPRARPVRCRASGASDDPATELDIG